MSHDPETVRHDPSTVLCIDCKHTRRPEGRPTNPRSCYHPAVRSVVDGSGSELIFTRYLTCKGVWWEPKPPPPKRRKTLWVKFLEACPFI